MKRLSNKIDYESILNKYDTFLFDCDGVIWNGNSLIPNAKQFLLHLKSLNKKVIYITNNSTKSRIEYKEKFDKLGIETTKNEIFGSAYCAAFYIANTLQLGQDKQVYVIGMNGICQELNEFGIRYCGSSNDNESLVDMTNLANINMENDVGAVLLGFDIDINYKKYAKGFTFLQDKNVHFLATNSDLTYPANNTVYPGTGALLAALTASVGRDPVVLGKPHQTMLDCIVDCFHLNRSKTIMIGDRLDTDIAFGKLGGMDTLLVLSGVTSESDLSSSSIIPDYVTQNIGDFYFK